MHAPCASQARACVLCVTTMRFAPSRSKPASLEAHGNTIWQLSCSHSTAICDQEFNNPKELRTYDAPVIAEHRGGTNTRQNMSKRPVPHPPHTRGTYCRPEPLYTEKLQVWCRNNLPKPSPCNIHATSCSHYNAFCSITSQTRICRRTW